MNEKVFTLLPVHNRCEVTRGLVDGLRSQTYTNHHLVLIDDGSTDGTVEMVREAIPGATVIRGRGDWWWAGALQQGLDWLKAGGAARADDIILMINDDAVIEPDFMEKAVAILLKTDGSVLQARILSLDGQRILDDGMVFHEEKLSFEPCAGIEPINCLTTNGMLVKWKDLQRIGNFHPRLLPHYLSDYEFTIRAGRRGLKLLVDPALTLKWDQEKSGHRDFKDESLLGFFRKLFSRKCPMNPIYRTSFAVLVGTLWHIPRHVAVIWLDAARMMGRHLRQAGFD